MNHDIQLAVLLDISGGHRPILIGGQWRDGSGELSHSLFPADQSVTGRLYQAGLDDVDVAVQAAERAWRDASWRGLLPQQRADVLYRVSALIVEHRQALSRLQTRDNGKPLAETLALVDSAAATARYFAAVCETLDEELPAQRSHEFMSLSLHEPIGVIAAITPWNSPIASEMQKIAPALAAGNAVVLKPAEATPLAALALGRMFELAGLPSGVLSVLPGRGTVVGEAIARHPLVRRISFTGGTRTGRHLAHVAAEKLISTSLELGGKSPTVVLDDADLEQAAQGVAYGIFSSAGQACIAGSRLFVPRALYACFIDRLQEIIQGLRIGHPELPGTHISPLISRAHRESVESYVQLARAEGGRIRCGGMVPDDPALAHGNYYLPTLIEGLPNHARTCQEEIFGPVLVALPYDDEDDLVQQCNDSAYGLAAGIWSADYRRALALARRLEVGTIWINTYKRFSISTPFGGVKDSGLGREKGRQGVLVHTQQKSLYLGLDAQPMGWARTAP